MKPERRRYAEWAPRFTGAPPAVGTYYLFILFCALSAAGIYWLPHFASVLIMPFHASGFVLQLYRPVVRRRVLPMRDQPAAVPQYAVRMSFARGTVYGSDEGHASFVDGWLVVQARGCAFSVRAADVCPSVSMLSLVFPGPASDHSLEFVHPERGFKEEWEVWRTRNATPEGQPIFPPVLPLPRPRGWDHALFAALLGVASFALPFHSPAAWPWLLGVAGLITWAIFAGRRRVDRVHARLAAGKPPRRGAWKILGAEVRLERLGEAFRADLRRRRKRRAVVRSLRP